MNKVYTKFLLQWVTNVVVAVTVEMVYVAERSVQLELHDSGHAGAAGVAFGADYVNVVEDTPVLSAAEM